MPSPGKRVLEVRHQLFHHLWGMCWVPSCLWLAPGSPAARVTGTWRAGVTHPRFICICCPAGMMSIVPALGMTRSLPADALTELASRGRRANVSFQAGGLGIRVAALRRSPSGPGSLSTRAGRQPCGRPDCQPRPTSPGAGAGGSPSTGLLSRDQPLQGNRAGTDGGTGCQTRGPAERDKPGTEPQSHRQARQEPAGGSRRFPTAGAGAAGWFPLDVGHKAEAVGLSTYVSGGQAASGPPGEEWPKRAPGSECRCLPPQELCIHLPGLIARSPKRGQVMTGPLQAPPSPGSLPSMSSPSASIHPPNSKCPGATATEGGAGGQGRVCGLPRVLGLD